MKIYDIKKIASQITVTLTNNTKLTNLLGFPDAFIV